MPAIQIAFRTQCYQNCTIVSGIGSGFLGGYITAARFGHTGILHVFVLYIYTHMFLFEIFVVVYNRAAIIFELGGFCKLRIRIIIIPILDSIGI